MHLEIKKPYSLHCTYRLGIKTQPRFNCITNFIHNLNQHGVSSIFGSFDQVLKIKHFLDVTINL